MIRHFCLKWIFYSFAIFIFYGTGVFAGTVTSATLSSWDDLTTEILKGHTKVPATVTDAQIIDALSKKLVTPSADPNPTRANAARLKLLDDLRSKPLSPAEREIFYSAGTSSRYSDFQIGTIGESGCQFEGCAAVNIDRSPLQLSFYLGGAVSADLTVDELRLASFTHEMAHAWVRVEAFRTLDPRFLATLYNQEPESGWSSYIRAVQNGSTLPPLTGRPAQYLDEFIANTLAWSRVKSKLLIGPSQVTDLLYKPFTEYITDAVSAIAWFQKKSPLDKLQIVSAYAQATQGNWGIDSEAIFVGIVGKPAMAGETSLFKVAYETYSLPGDQFYTAKLGWDPIFIAALDKYVEGWRELISDETAFMKVHQAARLSGEVLLVTGLPSAAQQLTEIGSQPIWNSKRNANGKFPLETYLNFLSHGLVEKFLRKFAGDSGLVSGGLLSDAQIANGLPALKPNDLRAIARGMLPRGPQDGFTIPLGLPPATGGVTPGSIDFSPSEIETTTLTSGGQIIETWRIKGTTGGSGFIKFTYDPNGFGPGRPRVSISNVKGIPERPGAGSFLRRLLREKYPTATFFSFLVETNYDGIVAAIQRDPVHPDFSEVPAWRDAGSGKFTLRIDFLNSPRNRSAVPAISLIVEPTTDGKQVWANEAAVKADLDYQEWAEALVPGAKRAIRDSLSPQIPDLSVNGAIRNKIFGRALYTSVPTALGLNGDPGLVTKIRVAMLATNTSLSNSQIWALNAAFDQMASKGILDHERTNLLMLNEFLDKGNLIEVPWQVFGNHGDFSSRDVIHRIAYLNWSGKERWKNPADLFLSLFEANYISQYSSGKSQSDAIEEARAKTISEYGRPDRHFGGLARERVAKMNATELYQFLTALQTLGSRTDFQIDDLAGRISAGEPLTTRSPDRSPWDPLVANNGNITATDPTAIGELEVSYKDGRVEKMRVTPDFNWGSLGDDVRLVKIRSYGPNPILPGLHAEVAVGYQNPNSDFLAGASQSVVDSQRTQADYANGRAAEGVQQAIDKPSPYGQQMIPKTIGKGWIEPKVDHGRLSDGGHFVEVTLARGTKESFAATERPAMDILTNPSWVMEVPAATGNTTQTYDYTKPPQIEKIPMLKAAMRAGIEGSALVLGNVAIPTTFSSYLQGKSTPEIISATIDASIKQFVSPENLAFMGFSAVFKRAAASSIPIVSNVGAVAAPFAEAVGVAMLGYGMTTAFADLSRQYDALPADSNRRGALVAALLLPGKVAAGVQDFTEYSALNRSMKNAGIDPGFYYDPDVQKYMDQVDNPQLADLKDAMMYAYNMNKQRPFMYTSGDQNELLGIGQRLMQLPSDQWEKHIDFTRDLNRASMGDQSVELSQYLSYENRMGAGQGTNLPVDTYLSAASKTIDPNESKLTDFYATPKRSEIQVGNLKMLSLENMNGRIVTLEEATAGLYRDVRARTDREKLDIAVQNAYEVANLGNSNRFAVVTGDSVGQLAANFMNEKAQTPQDADWWGAFASAPWGGFQYDEEFWDFGFTEKPFDQIAAGNTNYVGDDASSAWDAGINHNAYTDYALDLCIDPFTGGLGPCF